MTTTVINNWLFRSLFEKQKLTGNNFMEWYRNLLIVLCTKDKLPFLEQPIPVLPVPPQGQANPSDVVTGHQAWVKAQKEIAGLMLMTMEPDIQKNLEHLGVFDVLKQEEGQSVSSYVLKMKSYIDNLEHLGHAMTQNLSVSFILVSLRKEYDSFVQNYNIHSMGKTLTELHAMLKLHEQTLPPKEAPPFAPKPKNLTTPKKDNPTKDVICYQCGEMGIFTIELYSFPSTSWVYDTGCGTHICITTQGLRGSMKLKPGALSLYVGDGHRAAVEAIVSHLYKDGFVYRFENDNSISVFKNNMIYFNAIPHDDIYEIVMSSSNTNECSMYDVTNKRAKLNLDSTLLWHCHLGHINKKRIEKLQHDGLLDSTDIKSFEKCVACMSGKMARKPYSHQVEREKDLLGLIHTDEVENQLGKTIKLLGSNHGGEYTSQEFLDHLKDHGIIGHRTPPYTPQHNGVSERRNRTLLDMVRSMMSQTTLPKSFWDYALESVARILNMVPTKKVDKTPYEVWYEQAPKLSYLKV
ncbi:zinc finger, CCHC-type containing protein [Tanacetum coccineum]